MLFILTFVLVLTSFTPTIAHCCGPEISNKPTLQYPEITFTYGWRSCIMDAICSIYYGNEITDELKDKLEKQLPIFKDAWKKNAPIFFDAVFSVFKRGFKDSERTAIVNLSHYYSYGGHWFLIFSLRHYLEHEKLTNIKTEDAFSSTVFHELLHIWLDENLDEKKSRILAKYHNENKHVLTHLHLMAIEKMVYLKINRPNILARIDDSYRNFSSSEHRRAWEIVNDIEGHEIIVQDILACII